MSWIDGHLDLAYIAQCGCDLIKPVADAERYCISLPAIRAAGIDLAFATIFTEPGASQYHGYPSSADRVSAELAGLRQLELYENLEAAGELAIVRAADDLRGAITPKIVLLMEGADPIRSPEHIRMWFDRGLRVVGLTWAAGTRYAGGNSSGGPLTSEGSELVAAMDELGLVHDVSHLSDDAFDGLMECARAPVIASHSNCRALLEPKQRHLRDDQIRAIAERNGIIGLNLYSHFLAKGRRATIADCVAHVEHIANIVGHRNCVALGSDIDGGFPPSELPLDLDRPEKLHALAAALKNARWSKAEIEGFKSGNWRRFLAQALK